MLAKSMAGIALLCLSLTSCAQLEKLSSTEVPVKQIIVAATSVNAVETTAKEYIVYCTPNPAPSGCNDDLIRNKIVPGVKNIRTARDAAEQFVEDHPDATLGPKTLVDAVTTAVSALQTIISQNNIK